MRSGLAPLMELFHPHLRRHSRRPPHASSVIGLAEAPSRPLLRPRSWPTSASQASSPPPPEPSSPNSSLTSPGRFLFVPAVLPRPAPRRAHGSHRGHRLVRVRPGLRRHHPSSSPPSAPSHPAPTEPSPSSAPPPASSPPPSSPPSPSGPYASPPPRPSLPSRRHRRTLLRQPPRSHRRAKGWLGNDLVNLSSTLFAALHRPHFCYPSPSVAQQGKLRSICSLPQLNASPSHERISPMDLKTLQATRLANKGLTPLAPAT